MIKPCLHFVAIRGDRIAYAARIFGMPDFIHFGWDNRAAREIAENDVVIFGKGDEHDIPNVYAYQDPEE